MVRLIVKYNDISAAANVGGPVNTSYSTFDIEHAELEALLRRTVPSDYGHAEVVGAAVFPKDGASA